MSGAEQTKIYLCGPIAGCTTAEAQDWRSWVIEYTAGWADCYDPCRRRYGNDYTKMDWTVVKKIVELDKSDISRCDVLLANLLPDKTKTGSNMEIIHAWGIGKLVVIVLPEDQPISPWHRYHSQKIAHSLKQALEYIQWGNWCRPEEVSESSTGRDRVGVEKNRSWWDLSDDQRLAIEACVKSMPSSYEWDISQIADFEFSYDNGFLTATYYGRPVVSISAD